MSVHARFHVIVDSRHLLRHALYIVSLVHLLSCEPDTPASLSSRHPPRLPPQLSSRFIARSQPFQHISKRQLSVHIVDDSAGGAVRDLGPLGGRRGGVSAVAAHGARSGECEGEKRVAVASFLVTMIDPSSSPPPLVFFILVSSSTSTPSQKTTARPGPPPPF